MKIILLILFVMMIAVITLPMISCNKSDSQAAGNSSIEIPTKVTNDGTDILFPPGSPQLQWIETDSVKFQTLHLNITAPAHIAASVVPSEFGSSNLYLFESQDVTQLYADFVKSASAADRTSRQLERMKDLHAHMAVAEKDVVDAQHENAEAQADLAEKESRLRAAGIDPKALHETPAGSVWVLADIPENKLSSVHAHASAQLICNSFPNETFQGFVVALGDVVDPSTRTVKARIVLPNTTRVLKPGMFGNIIINETTQRALAVPRNAVVTVQGKSYIFKQVGAESFRRMAIQIGSETQDFYLVSTGLHPGDKIATGGIVLLKGLSFGY